MGTNVVTQDAVSSPTGYGVFGRLPSEVRREIWQYLLLVQYNTLSREPIVISKSVSDSDSISEEHGDIDAHSDDDKLDNELIFPGRRYDLCPTILYCSKALYHEASDIMYRENLFVRFQEEIHDDQDFDLIGGFLSTNSIGAFQGQSAASINSLAACKLLVMDVCVTLVKEQASPTKISTRQFIIPASVLFRLATYLHSMVLYLRGEEHFGDAEKLSLKVRNKYSISEELLFKRLLAPFRGLHGMREAMISGMHRTHRIKRLEASLAGSLGPGMHTEQNMHEWLRQVTKLFYTTSKQHNSVLNVVASYEAWEELHRNIDFGSAWPERTAKLSKSEQILLNRISFWSRLKMRKCEFKLSCLEHAYAFESPKDFDYLDHHMDTVQENYGSMAMACSGRGYFIDTDTANLPKEELMPEKHVSLLCRDLIEFCQHCEMTGDAVMYLERCKQSTLWNDEFDYQLDVPTESDGATGWRP